MVAFPIVGFAKKGLLLGWVWSSRVFNLKQTQLENAGSVRRFSKMFSFGQNHDEPEVFIFTKTALLFSGGCLVGWLVGWFAFVSLRGIFVIFLATISQTFFVCVISKSVAVMAVALFKVCWIICSSMNYCRCELQAVGWGSGMVMPLLCWARKVFLHIFTRTGTRDPFLAFFSRTEHIEPMCVSCPFSSHANQCTAWLFSFWDGQEALTMRSKTQ